MKEMQGNQLAIGNGIYTTTDIASILKLPRPKVTRWINEYWDGRLGKKYQQQYSWEVDGKKAVNFHTLIELYILILLGDAGINTRSVLKAHEELGNLFETAYPFANKKILDGIRTDSKKVFFDYGKQGGGLISLDGNRQFQIEYMKTFFKSIEFDKNLLATRLYPLGKKKQIVVDPDHNFGYPVIKNTNIAPEMIYQMYQAGDKKKLIAHAYEISLKAVNDAIQYCDAA
jgi:uncharacterized protein (DUF433 family)